MVREVIGQCNDAVCIREQRVFGISKNNKGLPCPFKQITCQEGYCSECLIYLEWQKSA
jgi:hypothetical protein